jgi:alpha-tubulin suppressor-like RCC1 family protein
MIEPILTDTFICADESTFIVKNNILYACGKKGRRDYTFLDKFTKQNIPDVISIGKYSYNGFSFILTMSGLHLYEYFHSCNEYCITSTLFKNVLMMKSSRYNIFVLTDEGLLIYGLNHKRLDYYDIKTSVANSFIKIKINNVITIACGDDHSLVLTKEGLFYCRNEEAYTLSKIEISDVINVECGSSHSLILTKKGLYQYDLYNKSYKEVIEMHEQNKDFHIISLSCGHNFSFILTGNGLFEFRSDDCTTWKKINLQDVIMIDCSLHVRTSNRYYLVQTKDGYYSRGDNNYGQLGLGHCESRHEFTKIEDF